MRRIPSIVGVVIVLALAPSVPGVSTQVWEMNEYRIFLSGTFESVSLDDEGRLTLAPRIETVFEGEEAAAWSAARAPDGTVYIGTGHAGKLFRIEPKSGVEGGPAKLLWQAPEIEIFALAVAPNGDVFAGTSPGGKIYRIRPNGDAVAFFDPKALYIWSLQFSPSEAAPNSGFGGPSHLYVGTGGEGKIYRVGPDGLGEVYFDTGQRHIISMALNAEGKLLAGSDPNGILYRVDGTGSAFALYDSDLPEIRAIRAGPGSVIYLAAMGGGFSLADQMTQSVSATTTISVTATAPGPGSSPPAVATPPGAPGMATSAPATTYTPKVVNYGVKTSSVLRLEPGRGAEEIWSSTEENALALAVIDQEAEQLLVASDKGGRLYRVGRDRRTQLTAQTDQQQITSLTSVDAGTLMTSAHTTAGLLLSDQPAESGSYVTTVRDAGAIARWGRLSWRGRGRVSFQTRTGNSPRPDNSWSEWSLPISGPDGGAIASPPARYAQWRAALHAGEEPAVIERVRITYLPGNRAPTVSSVQIREETSEANPTKSPGRESTAAYSVTVSAAPGGSSAAETSQTSNKANGGQGSGLSVSWTAQDPDGDDLSALVEFRGEGETSWKTIAKDVTAKKVSIDGETLADGRYWFRVTVTDGPSNPADNVRQALEISSPVLVDYTSPRVTAMGSSGGQVRFEAVDDASMIERAEYSIDAKGWQPLRSDDGMTDSRQESFTIDISGVEGLEPGEHLITLRVRDRAGNAGLAKSVVR